MKICCKNRKVIAYLVNNNFLRSIDFKTSNHFPAVDPFTFDNISWLYECAISTEYYNCWNDV